MQRGAINNPGRGMQLRDFTGLRYGNITPTDIDAFLDFGNKVFVFIEAKYQEAKLPYGQRLAIERLCDSSRVPAFLLVVSHNNPPDELVDFANAEVVEFFYQNRWYPVGVPVKCEDMVDFIRRMYTYP